MAGLISSYWGGEQTPRSAEAIAATRRMMAGRERRPLCCLIADSRITPTKAIASGRIDAPDFS
jgi:hypothetical protein